MQRRSTQRKHTHNLRFADFIVLFLAVTITVFCAVRIYARNDSSLHFVIQGKKGSWVYPINQTVQVDIAGPLGLTTVSLKDGKAQILVSPCVNQTCVTSGPVEHKGQWIACLPNAVFVRVESGNEKQTELDAVVW
jgi:hypothetical protein